jgi:glycosyltransferase involved in cell wall biosynthesis
MNGVSVIVPTRNRGRLLATTLRSVLWQRDVELEVIVVDDASAHDPAEVIANLADPRVVMVRHEQPRGPSAARNRGAREASGEWIGFVDDDDVWAPDKLIRQVDAADASGRIWSYVGAVNIGSHLEIVSGRQPPTPEQVIAALPRYNPVPGGGSNVVLRRPMLDELGGFDERFPPCEDWEMWVRLARSGLPACVRHPLMGYRLHEGSSSLDPAMVVRCARLLEQVHGTTVDWGRLHRWLAESFLRMDAHAEALGQFAHAAVRGQARGVASDLLAVLRRRLPSAMGGGGARRGASGPTEWISEASVWLRELRPLDPMNLEENGLGDGSHRAPG